MFSLYRGLKPGRCSKATMNKLVLKDIEQPNVPPSGLCKDTWQTDNKCEMHKLQDLGNFFSLHNFFFEEFFNFCLFFLNYIFLLWDYFFQLFINVIVGKLDELCCYNCHCVNWSFLPSFIFIIYFLIIFFITCGNLLIQNPF